MSAGTIEAPPTGPPPVGAAPRGGGARWARRRRRLGEAATGWAFAGPGTVLVVGLSIFPAV